MLYETDYPHTDTSWPDCHDVVAGYTAGLSDEQAAMVVAGNAADLFRVELG